MRSARVTPNTVGTPNEHNALISDASGAASLLAHQMFGTIALPTNPTDGQTLTVTINGNAVILTAVATISGAAAGSFLIAGTAALTDANLHALLINPTITNANQVAMGKNTDASVTLVNYINWSLSGTGIIASSFNSPLYAPATSFAASATITGGSYTANTMALYVEPGVFYIAGTRVLFAGGATPTVTAPVSNPRIDVLSINSTGILSWTVGTESTSPSVPSYPSAASSLPICEIYNVVGETSVYDAANQNGGSGYILNDVRPFQQPSMNWNAFPADIVPDGDGTRNIGSPSNEFDNIYAKSGIFLNGSAFGSQLSFAGTALESISAGAPVAVGVGQTADIGYDTSGKTTSTGSLTVGSNSNRVLIVVVMGSANSGSSCTISGSFSGATLSFTNNQYSSGSNPFTVATAVLVAPPTGSGSFSLSAAGTGAVVNAVFYFSLFNCSQTSPQDNAAANISSSTSASLSMPINTDGALTVGVIFSDQLTSTIGTPSGMVYAANTSTGTNPGYALGTSGTTVIYPANTTVSISTSGSSGGPLLAAILSVKPFTEATAGVLNASSASLASGNTRCTGLIGFAVTSVSAGQSLTVVTNGIATGLSGLILGAEYYLNDTNGTIGISAGTNMRKVGVAASQTSLLLTNIW